MEGFILFGFWLLWVYISTDTRDYSLIKLNLTFGTMLSIIADAEKQETWVQNSEFVNQ